LPKQNSIVVCLTLLLTLLQPTKGSAKGGTFSLEQLYNPEHIAWLPLEIRRVVASKCPEPRATHEFSNYSGGTREIVLHYEHLLCGLSQIHCVHNACLHEIYSRSPNGRYRLRRSFYTTQPEEKRH
jgi:hypothetical protein